MADRRSISLSLLSFVFFWLAVAGMAFGILSIRNPAQLQQAGIQPQAIAAIAFAYAICAGGVTVGAWMRAQWLPWAIAIWGVGLGIMMVALQAMIGIRCEPLLLVLAPYLLFGVLTWTLVRFSLRKIRDHAT